MRQTNFSKHHFAQLLFPVWLLIIAAGAAHASVKLELRNGRPVVDGVSINGHGPCRFLLDTGSNLNLVDERLARKIGMIATGRVELASATGTTPVAQSDGNEISLDTATASDQRFLFSSLDAIHASMPDVQGVLGNWFLARFDFALDFKSKKLSFGPLEDSDEPKGARINFRMINLRPVITASLGNLAIDSGQVRVVLFGVQPDEVETGYQMRTVTGT